MRVGWNRVQQSPVLPSILVSAAVVFAAIRLAPVRKTHEPTSYAMGAAELPAGPSVNVPIGASKGASAHHVRVADEVRPHVHRRHDETIVVISGRGRMQLGTRTVDVLPGAVLIVPRGTVHSLTVDGGVVEAVSVFSPPFDGHDRVFIDE